MATIDVIAAVLFGLAVLHTFGARQFEPLGSCPPLLDEAYVDEVVMVEEADAIRTGLNMSVMATGLIGAMMLHGIAPGPNLIAEHPGALRQVHVLQALLRCTAGFPGQVRTICNFPVRTYAQG